MSRDIDADIFINSLLYNEVLTLKDASTGRVHIGNINDRLFFYNLSNPDKQVIDVYLKSKSLEVLKNNDIDYEYALRIFELLSSENKPHSGNIVAANTIIKKALADLRNESKKIETTAGFRKNVNYIVSNITLIDYSSNIPKTATLYYNEEIFRKNLIYVKGNFTRGEGGYNLYRRAIPVMIGGDKRPGLLVAEVIIPNPPGSGLFG